MEYPKIDTLFERDPETFVVDPTRLKKPVFGTITEWDVTEKVDGTNIRVAFTPAELTPPAQIASGDYWAPSNARVKFRGRTNAAKIPGDLLKYLQKTFTPELFATHFQTPVILYGEGYGAGIQKVGGLYRADKSFILFDVLIDNLWWMDTKQVADIGQTLGIDVVPYLGRRSLSEIIDKVRKPFNSLVGHQAFAEGIVARPIETLFDKRHERVILKLKTKDFSAGKR